MKLGVMVLQGGSFDDGGDMYVDSTGNEKVGARLLRKIADPDASWTGAIPLKGWDRADTVGCVV